MVPKTGIRLSKKPKSSYPYADVIARTTIPVNINKMTAGNFVFRAKASNRYEKIISNGKTNKMIRVFMDLNLSLNYKNWEGV